MKQKLIEYIRTLFGTTPGIHIYEKSALLPLHLRTGNTFYVMELFDRTVLLVFPSSEGGLTPVKIRKQFEIISAITKMDPVVILGGITPVMRKRLIEAAVSFIVPGTQLFLPLLQIDLREHFSKFRERPVYCSPATQVTLLHDIYFGLNRPETPGALAARLGYTKMTMSRVIDELEALEICDVEEIGKNRFVHLRYDGKELWEKTNGFMKSPVKKRVFGRFAKNTFEIKLKRAGETALAEKTLLSAGELPVYAIDKDGIARLQNRDEIAVAEAPFDAQFIIEIWHYDPQLFSGDSETVDDCSLYLSLRGSDDERIRQALGKLMENVSWR